MQLPLVAPAPVVVEHAQVFQQGQSPTAVFSTLFAQH